MHLSNMNGFDSIMKILGMEQFSWSLNKNSKLKVPKNFTTPNTSAWKTLFFSGQSWLND